MKYRIVVWLLLAFEVANVTGILHSPDREPGSSWTSQLLYHLCGYALFEGGLWFLRKVKITIPPYVFLWLIAAILHNQFGVMFGLISRFTWYDQVAHFALMGFFLALVVLAVVQNILRLFSIDTLQFILVATFCVSETLGVANEVIEYILELIEPTPLIILTPTDTANDLLMNTLGISLFLLAYLLFKRFYRRDRVR